MALAQHQGATFIGLVLGFQFTPSSHHYNFNKNFYFGKPFFISAN
jgi:hypothetical protein